MRQKKSYLSLSLIGAILVILSGCKKDEDPPLVELEVITTASFSMVKVGAMDEVILTYQDTDGIGGNDPIVEGATLCPNTVYFSMLDLLDESKVPTEDISTLIEANSESYQVFFTANGIDLSFTYADQDDTGFPIGLFTAINTGEIGTGSIIISIVRSPNKSAQGVADGLINNAGGSTLLQINFPITIQ